MPDGKIRIGILGAGAMGAMHGTAYADMADVEIVGVFARDPGRARSVAALCKAEAFTDAATLIRHRSVDAIDVCLPSAIHRDFVIEALGQGRHVFCESPLALDLADARRMLEAARRADRLLQVGLLMRSVSAYEHIKALAVSGEQGCLLSLATWRLGSYLRPGAPDHKAHYSDPSTELMTFDFDVASWLLGSPARLSASATRTPQGGPGEISALLDYDDGRQATIVASGLMPRGFPFSVGFRALFEGAAFELRTVFEGGGPPRNAFTIVDDTGPARPVAIPGRNPYQVELQRFADCIRGRADPHLLDAERAIEALVLSTATQRALEIREQVPVVTGTRHVPGPDAIT
jgi:predicted dehydrogenase